VNTSDINYTLLIETSAISLKALSAFIRISFTHNAKNEGTLAARGADYEVRIFNVTRSFEDVVASFRWTDSLADYKVMSVICFVMGLSLTDAQSGDMLKVRVYWKVDNAAYPAWSKERFLLAEDIQRTGKEAVTPWY